MTEMTAIERLDLMDEVNVTLVSYGEQPFPIWEMVLWTDRELVEVAASVRENFTRDERMEAA